MMVTCPPLPHQEVTFELTGSEVIRGNHSCWEAEAELYSRKESEGRAKKTQPDSFNLLKSLCSFDKVSTKAKIYTNVFNRETLIRPIVVFQGQLWQLYADIQHV